MPVLFAWRGIVCVWGFCVWAFRADPALLTNTKTEMIWLFVFLGLLDFYRWEYLLHKGQNINREAESTHCLHSGCYSMTIYIYFWASRGNYCSVSTSSACLFPMLWMIYFFSHLFWLYFLQHTACLCDAVIALLKVPLSFQRYFFQKLQSTSIKVSTAQTWPKISLYAVFTRKALLRSQSFSIFSEDP